MQGVIYIILGYLSGSVLYARVFAWVFNKENMLDDSKDNNPGTANAFMFGGFWCGTLTLICDILKGFLPVFLLLPRSISGSHTILSALLIAAPVVGHAFPVFFKFRGGKGIAVSFGCLAGLLPFAAPLVALALFFIFFSVILRVKSHFHRTLVTYAAVLFCMPMITKSAVVLLGFALIAVTVYIRMLASKEKRERPEVRLLWMH